MKIKISPILQLKGRIVAPPSKSYSHRAFIAAALSKGVSLIRNPLVSGDVAVTINILKSLGVKILKETDDTYIVLHEENSFSPQAEELDCKNSGTTIRFMSAFSLIVKDGLTFKGEFLKRKRPILPFLEALKKLGAVYKLNGNKLSIMRKLTHCDKTNIVGNISSQFISALLMICPVLHCDNTCFINIKITEPIVSYPYIQMTKDVLTSFGIEISEKLNQDNTIHYIIRCAQNYRPQIYDIPGDFSSIAFLIAAAVLTKEDSELIIQNLDFKKPQGDKMLIKILKDMGAKIEINKNLGELKVYGNINKYPLKGININCKEIPDLFPILSIIGVFAKGKTKLYNAAHLRYKESDRIAILSRELKKLGVKVKEQKDELTIYHCKNLKGSKIYHHGDHRVAMSLIIACLFADSESQLSNAEIINDSYPNFFSHLKQVGAPIELNDC